MKVLNANKTVWQLRAETFNRTIHTPIALASTRAETFQDFAPALTSSGELDITYSGHGGPFVQV